MNRTYGMRLVGLAAYAPPNIVSNDDIAERLRQEGVPVLAALGRDPTLKESRVFRTNDEWINKHIGFAERRFANPGEGTIDLAIRAAKLVLDKAEVRPEQVGGIFFASVSPSYLYSPPDSALLQEALGIPPMADGLPRETFGADISLACCSWGAALRMAYHFIGQSEYTLVIGADAMSTTINYRDRAFMVVLGDAGTATLCQRVPVEEDWFGPSRFFTWLDGSRSDVIKAPAGGSRNPLTKVEQLSTYQHRLAMDGARVREEMIPFVSGPGIDAALVKAGMRLQELDALILHEANRVLNAGIVEALRQRGFRGEVVDAGGKFGNTTSASVPLALALNASKLTIGQNVALVMFGGGYSFASSIMTIKSDLRGWFDV